MTREPSEAIKKARRKVSFRGAIIQLLIGSLMLTVLGIGFVAYGRSRESLQVMKQNDYSAANRAISRRLNELLAPAEHTLDELRRLIERGLLDTSDPDRLGMFFVERIRPQTKLAWLSYSEAETGRFTGATRIGLESIVLNRSEPWTDGGKPREWLVGRDGSHIVLDRGLPHGYDPRTREWYKKAVEANAEIVWTDPYEFNEGMPGITAAVAITGPNGAAGVLTADILLREISNNLAELLPRQRRAIFVQDAKGATIACESSLALPAGPIVGRAWELARNALEASPDGEAQIVAFRLAGVAYDAVMMRFSTSRNLKFIAGLVAPEEELMGMAKRNFRFTLVLGLVAVVIAAGVGIWFAGHLAQPLLEISRDLERVARFDITDRPAPRSGVREIAIVSDSVERMKAGLRSFGRYVPRTVVRELIERKREARTGGEIRRLTLLFTDIEGFTRMSEGLAPREVVNLLEDFFETCSDVLEREFRGTLDKFMGDGVLAFFGAPGDVPDHAIQACRAALRIQERLSSLSAIRESHGLPPLRTRTGIHTGDVLVGNIGTPERFSYTVVGDAVNLASRLEALNKSYGTSILASKETIEATGETFSTRRVDSVVVRGRTGATEIFELLGEGERRAEPELQSLTLLTGP